MAISTYTDICNLALIKSGHKKVITDAELATPGNNKAAELCSLLYEFERDRLIESHPWKFAKKRINYDIDNFKDTITATTSASPVVVTGTDISDANIIEGIGVYIWDTNVDDLDGEIFVATNISGETFELYETDRETPFDGSDIDAATSGYVRICPLSEYSYMYKLPSDYLRVWKNKENDITWQREGDYILTDEDEIYLVYIAQITTATAFPAAFLDCYITKMAAELAGVLGDKPERKLKLLEELEKIHLPKAHRLNAIEDIPEDNQRRKNQAKTPWQKEGH